MPRRLSVPGAVLLVALSASPAATAEKQPTFAVRRPTVIASFPPVTQAELETDPDTNETLADFQLYAAKVREPLQKLGIDFHVVYARSFRIRIGAEVVVFRPDDIQVGYYFVAPGKKPRIEYGVNTDLGLLEIARDSFGIAAE